MQIQLKQHEIVAAIKMYVAQQGINLAHRCVEVTFTAGRKESGLSADVSIEDQVEVPEFFMDAQDDPEANAPVLTVVKAAAELNAVDVIQPVPAKSTSLFN